MRKVVALLVIFAALIAMATCRPATKEEPEVMCRLPMAKGFCRALLPRWRYDATTGKCVEFKYGGCNGNANNFMSQKSCMAACEGIS